MTTTPTTHACPPDGSGLTPCCRRSPVELPRTDRLTQDESAVTCTSPWRILGANPEQPYRNDPPMPPVPDDGLRQRIATALLARIKLATISGPQPFGMDAMTRMLAATEYDLADVVLPIVAAERADAVREEARALRRTPVDSRDYPAALTGARIIEDRLRSRAAATQDGGV
jgi:hypothetical protein